MQLTKLDPDQLESKFSDRRGIDSERAIFCADLLYEMAVISDDKAFPKACHRLKMLSLNLYVAAIPQDDQFQTCEKLGRVAGLIEELNESHCSGQMVKNIEIYQKYLEQRNLN